MASVIYRITAVPERLRNAIVEANAIGVGCDAIYVDEAHNGSVWNKFRVYEDIIRSKSASHVCMCDDDLIIHNNFASVVDALANQYSDCIFTFYDSKIGGNEPRLIKLLNHGMNGGACLIPTKILQGFLSFYRSELDGFRWDDTAMSLYATFNQIDVILVTPKLVDVLQIPSTLTMRKNRISPHNKGFNYEELIDATKIARAPMIEKGPAIFNSHLPKDHPVRIKYEQYVEVKR